MVLTSLYNYQMFLCLAGFYFLLICFFYLFGWFFWINCQCLYLSCLYLSVVQNVPIWASYCSIDLIIWLSTNKYSFLTTFNLLHGCHHWLEHVMLPPGLGSPTFVSDRALVALASAALFLQLRNVLTTWINNNYPFPLILIFSSIFHYLNVRI